MAKNILIIGRRQIVIDDIVNQLHMPGIQLFGGTGLDDVRSTFAQMDIDHVILGGGIDLETRLKIVGEIFRSSNATTVHMNSPSGPQSFLPFVRAVLNGIKDWCASEKTRSKAPPIPDQNLTKPPKS